MKNETEFPSETREIPDLGITMRDGTRLSARVWLPTDADVDPVPAILEYLPYRKRDGTIVRDEITHPWLAGHRYACIRVDIRGNGESEGLMHDEYTEQELNDACQVIHWLSEQSWCNGNVGMMGISWGGFNGLQVAALNPPALKAVVTVCSTVDRYADDIHYKGGCLLGANFSWASQMLSYSSRPPDPEIVGDQNWLDMWRHRLENQSWLWTPWHQHQHRDAYWEHGSICEDYTAIKAAILSLGGWHDGYRNTISHLVENINSPVKGIVGPWIHKYPHYAGPKPAIGFLQEMKRWWDQYLKGVDTGVEADPDYRVWLMDSLKPERWFEERPGRWISEKNWPSQDIKKHTFHLGDLGLGKLPTELSINVSSEQNCGSTAGEFFPFAFSNELPAEQTPDDDLSFCCDSEVMQEHSDIVGAPTFRATLSCNKTQGQICVRLCDLRPDGSSALITHGVFNLTHHSSHKTPAALEPDKEFEIEFALDQIAYRLPAGHRIRVAISNAYWPYIWPSPERHSIRLRRASLDVPCRSIAEKDECGFEEPCGSMPWQHEVIRPASFSKTTSLDEENGEAVTILEIDNGENRDLDHGLISGSWSRERWSILSNDPSSAVSEIEWEQTGGREGKMWRTESSSRMWCDENRFYSTATLRVWLNQEQFFEKTFRDSVERKLV